MEQNPKVSIIIPVYNTEAYVRAAIQSILQQSLQELEVIVVNDGSTDGSLKIIEEMAAVDKRMKVYSQTNQGLSIARNIGFSHATGKYVYFMDSDDLLENDALELCYEKCEIKKLDFVFFDAECFLDEETLSNKQLEYRRTQKLSDNIYSGIEMMNIQLQLFQFQSAVWLNFINKNFLDKHNLLFYPGIIHEDQLFSSQLYLLASRISFIRRSFFHRRIRSNSIMTRNFKWKNMQGYLTVANELSKNRKLFPHEASDTIDLFLSQMLNASVWQAHVLPLKQRIYLCMLCLRKYKKYVCNKTLVVLLLKPYLHRNKQ